MQQAVAAFHGLSRSLWRQTCVDTNTSVKMQVYRALVAQVLLYGSHSWILNAAQLEVRLELRLNDRMLNEDLLRQGQQPSIAAQLQQRPIQSHRRCRSCAAIDGCWHFRSRSFLSILSVSHCVFVLLLLMIFSSWKVCFICLIAQFRQKRACTNPRLRLE